MKTSNKVSIAPYRNYLLVRKKITSVTASGLLLSDESAQVGSFGEVIGAGQEIKGDIRAGDRLMFTEYNAFELTDKAIDELLQGDNAEFETGYQYHLINEEDILLVVRNAG